MFFLSFYSRSWSSFQILGFFIRFVGWLLVVIWGAGTSFLVEKIQRLAMVRCSGGIYGGGDVGRLLWCLLLWVWSCGREWLIRVWRREDEGVAGVDSDQRWWGCGGKRRWQENRCCNSLVWPVVDSGGAADVDSGDDFGFF